MRVAIPLFFALELYAQGAAAQFTGPPPSPDVHIDTVTVEANRIPPDKVIHDFVKSYAKPTPWLGKIARWSKDQPICPQASGLTPAFNVFISERIRAVAGLVGAPVQTKVPCKGNMMVWFTPHPQVVLNDVASKQEYLLGYHDASQTKSLSTVTHPIQAWYSTATRDYNGVARTDDPQSFADCVELAKIEAQGIVSGAKGAMKCSPATVGSPIMDELQSEISTVVIVVDSTKVVGMPVGAIADYIAMLALSQTQAFETCQPIQSITNLMTADCDAQKSQGLTGMDVAYLKGLYNMNPNLIGSLQTVEIAHRMEAALGGR